MKKRLKIYKTPEEVEKFKKEFYNRVCLQELLLKSFMTQQRHLHDQKMNKIKKKSKFNFSAS